MARGSGPRVVKTTLTVSLTQEQKSELVKQAELRGMATVSELLRYLAQAFENGSIFIIEAPTFKLLKEEAEERLYRAVSRIARREVGLEMVERGFSTTPHRH